MNTNFYFNITLEFGLFSIGLGIITLCYTIGKGLGLAGANARANYVYGAMVGLYAAYFITILWLLNSFYRANIMIPGHVYLRLFVAIAFLALYVANQNYLRTHVSVMALHVFLLCLFWLTTHIMGLDNLFYILIALDALTALAVMLICIDNPGVYENTVAGIKYLVFSAVTSVLAYLGAILVLWTGGTVVVSQLAGGHINISLLAAEPVVFSLFGAGIVLIFIKFLFLFGVFPFQYYTIDAICSMSWSGILIFLIFLKMPALFAYMIFIDIYGALAADYKSLLLVIALMSVFVTTLKMFSTFRLGTFFGISSANQFSYIVLVSLFANPKALYAVFAIFVSYACALAIVMIVFNAVSDADGRDLGSWVAAFTFHDINDLLVAMRKIPFFTMARRDNLGPRSGDSNGRGGSLQAYNREAVVNTLQASLSVAFFSLGGFPATAGFVGKIFTILILIEANYYVTAAAVSFLSAVTATIYGLAAFACVSGPSNDKRSAFPTVRSLTKTNLLLIGVLAILLILGGVLGFQPLAPRWILEFWAVFS